MKRGTPLPRLAVSCTLSVTGWDEAMAWFPGLGSYVEKQFLRALQLSSPMSRAEAKSVVKKIAARESFEVQLAVDRYAQGMFHWLESIGGQVEIRRDGAAEAPAAVLIARSRLGEDRHAGEVTMLTSMDAASAL